MWTFAPVSNFPAAPKLSPIWHGVQTDGVNFYLLENFIYWSDLLDAAITVPINFITDMASIPRPLWTLYPPWGKYGPAAILHDWLYWQQSLTGKREVADQIFHEAMISCGCDRVTVAELYAALALFGEFAWQNNARLKASGYTKMFVPDVAPTHA